MNPNFSSGLTHQKMIGFFFAKNNLLCRGETGRKLQVYTANAKMPPRQKGKMGGKSWSFSRKHVYIKGGCPGYLFIRFFRKRIEAFTR